MRITHTVLPEEAGLTLQSLLRGPMGLSYRQLTAAKRSGGVTVDGAPFFANQPVAAGMCVRVDLPDYPVAPASVSPLPPAEILYLDEALAAVYKPALLQCHPSSSAVRGSDTLQARVCASIGGNAHPVHRLDAETAGIVLFARIPYAQAHLQRQMAQGSFQKTYRAWVCGTPDAHGRISAPIARLTPDSFTRVVRPDGQPAVSLYTRLSALSLPAGDVSLLELSPLTGRTHQLRVHMAHIGFPLLGDRRYHTPQSLALADALGIGWHQLCAVSLSFIHPLTGEPLTLSAPPRFAFDPASAR